MIKIQSYNNPLFYQVDRSYNLPGITGAVQWNGANKCFEVSTGAGWQQIDPTIELDHNPEYSKVLEWAKNKMYEEEKMQALRSKYPSLDEAYKHLEFIKEMVKDHE